MAAEPERVVVAIGALAWLIALLVFVLSEPLDHGYVRYAGIADAMLRTGDWVVPHVLGRVYLDKPPLVPWLVALPGLLLGRVPSWAPHVPSLLALPFFLIWTAALARRLFGRREPAWTATLVALTTWRVGFELRGERLDFLFATLTLGAAWHGYAALTETPPSRRRAGHWAVAGALAGLAFLTKGLLGPLFPALAVVAFCVWTRRAAQLAGWEPWVGLAALLAVALPWPALLVSRLGLDATREALASTRFVTRFGGPLHYLGNVPTALAPWVIFLPAAVAHWGRPPRPRASDALRFLVCWLGAVLVPLHLVDAKHVRYMLPALPAAALLLTTLWWNAGSGKRAFPTGLARWLRDGASRLGLALLGLAGVGAVVALPWMPAPRALVAAAGASLAAFAGWTLCRGRADPVRRLQALLACVLLTFATVDAVRAAGFRADTCWPGAERALASIPPDAALRSWRLAETASLEVELAARHPVSRMRSARDLQRALRGTGYVVGPPQAAEAIRGARPDLRVSAAGGFCLRGKDRVLLRVGSAGR